MSGDPGDEDYDRALRSFVAEREQISRSQAHVWHNCILATFVAFVVLLVGANFGEGQIIDTIDRIIPLTMDDEPVGFGLFLWFVSALALAFIAYSHSRILYYSDLADLMASEFKPDKGELLEWDDLGGEESGNRLTDLRRQFYSNYEHILTIQFLEKEHRIIHEEPVKTGKKPDPGHRLVSGVILPIVEFLAGGKWISLDPRMAEEAPFKYHYRAQFWPHASCRSISLGFFWASIGGAWAAMQTGLPGLSNILLIVTAISLVSYFFQYVRFSGGIERLSETAQEDTSQQAPYTCPACQAELTVGENCRECGQEIDWDRAALP